MLDDIEISNKQIVFEGDFNLTFNCKLERNGRISALKSKSLVKLIEINESLNLCDTSRIWNPPPPPPPEKKKKFHQDQVSGFIQKLDYFFISNTLQDFAKRTHVFASFSKDNFLIKMSKRWIFFNKQKNI